MVDPLMAPPNEEVRDATERSSSSRPWQRHLLVSVTLVVAFWAVALTSHLFVDQPFDYWQRPVFVGHFPMSQGRFVTLAEAALELTALVLLAPALLLGAVALARRLPRDPLAALDARVGQDGWHFVLLLAVIACAGAAFVAFGLLQSAPLIDDERAYAFEAHLLASGHVGLPAAPAALRNPMMLTEPFWTSKYPIGHSLLLALGALAGEPRLVPVLLASVLVVATYSFTRDAFGERQARLSATLVSLSPLVWANFGTLMAWTTTATAFACFLAAFVRAERTGRGVYAYAAGAAMGLIAIARPSECAGLAAPFAVTLIASAVRGGRVERARLGLAALGFASVGAILLWHDHAVTGSAWKLPYMLDPEMYRLGFGRTMPGGNYVHTPAAAVANLAGVVMRFDFWLLAWPGSMTLVLLGFMRTGKNRYDRLLLATLATYVVVYAFVYAPGTWDTGPTYYVVWTAPLVVLAVRGLAALRAFAQAHGSTWCVRAVGWLPLAGLVIAWTSVAPMRLTNLAALAREIREPWETIARSGVGDAIVVLRPPAERRPAGWAFGYPYEIATGPTTRAHLVAPATGAELAEAVRFIGEGPLFRLEIDDDLWKRRQRRRYRVVPYGAN